MRPLVLLSSFLLFLLRASASDTAYKTSISFYSSGYKLQGDLILPKRPGPVPVVVFLVGSGPNTSHRSDYRRMLEEAFEKQLLPEGVGLFYFDKRGVAPSEGKWQETDFYGRADDAKAAIDALKTLPEIDPARIGLAGHSQGGWIAQVAAARYPQDVAFIVSLAGPTFSVRKQVLNDVQSQYRCQGLDSVVVHRKAARKTFATFAFTSMAPLYPQWRQLKVIGGFDPAREIKALRCPTLYLFGENDRLVYPQWGIEHLEQIFPGGLPPHIEYRVIPGANHGFVLADFCYNGYWKERPYSPVFLATLKEWVTKQALR